MCMQCEPRLGEQAQILDTLGVSNGVWFTSLHCFANGSGLICDMKWLFSDHSFRPDSKQDNALFTWQVTLPTGTIRHYNIDYFSKSKQVVTIDDWLNS